MQLYQRPSAFSDRTIQGANGQALLPPFRLLCLFLLAVFSAHFSKCFAGTDDIPRGDRIAIREIGSAAENRAIPAADASELMNVPMDSPMSLPVNFGDGAAEPSIPSFTASSPLVLDEAFSIVEKPERTDRRISSNRCVLFNRGLCEAMKSKPVLALAMLQTAALISDGVTTRQYLSRGYVEVDPLTRILIGSKPTWARMAPLGMVQVLAGMWLAERMSSSPHVWVRRLRWLPQIAGIAANAAAATHNVTLR